MKIGKIAIRIGGGGTEGIVVTGDVAKNVEKTAAITETAIDHRRKN